jgi:hypothetical protein
MRAVPVKKITAVITAAINSAKIKTALRIPESDLKSTAWPIHFFE